ncbi:MAG: DUF1365 domain-containing protein [Solirubrobacterales bacterium]
MTATAVRPRPLEHAASAPASNRGSAIYEGWVAHRRTSPVPHSFRYRIFMPLFDLDELPGLLDDIPLWSARRRAPARFRRSDYLGSPDASIADSARDLVAERTGRRPQGPVKLLANPRYWGVGLNPVAFYYLYGAGPEAGVQAMIAQVTNTPWGEQRSYVLEAGPEGLAGSFDKRMHVSPFMPMEQRYAWSANEPGERLTVSIQNHEAGELVFEASVGLERHAITPASMRGLLFRYPPVTIATIARIYMNAVKLKLKGVPYFSHPRGGGQ